MECDKLKFNDKITSGFLNPKKRWPRVINYDKQDLYLYKTINFYFVQIQNIIYNIMLYVSFCQCIYICIIGI